jgi:thioredoxin reductase (NADPH)
MAEKRRIVIVGSGAAGWTAAIYASRAGLEPLVVTGLQRGGQLTITHDVENFPGFPTAVGGQELMERMEAQAVAYGTAVADDTVVSVDFSKRPFLLVGSEGGVWEADAVIIATGATAKWLGVEGEDRYFGRGYSMCAVCDSFAVRGKEAAVVGGGNTAVEEALYLSNICSTVHLVHRRDSLKSERILRDRLLSKENVVVHWNTKVKKIAGDERPTGGVTGLELVSTVDGSERFLHVAGVFGAIGHAPASKPFEGQLDLDEHGYVLVAPGTTRTSRDFVWAAGDVADTQWRQAATAAGFGCMAALDAERMLTAEAA